VTCRAASRVGITVCRLRWHPTYAGEQPVYMKEAAPGLLGLDDETSSPAADSRIHRPVDEAEQVIVAHRPVVS
jgi:hypothetical protein